MKQYFLIQIKRAVRLFPFVLAVTVALLLGLALILAGLVTVIRSDERGAQFTVALSGDTDDEYLQWGITALQTIDEERFSIRIVEMEEADAQKALKKGEISAYVLLPERFMDKAVTGEIEPVTYVTAAGMEGVASMLKKEVTAIVTDMVVYSQKGVYGVFDALSDNEVPVDRYGHMTNLSLQYTELIFHRDKLYGVEELGISDGLTTRDYYICAIGVLLIVLAGIPFAILYIKRDQALSRLLLCRGYSVAGQVACEYAAHLLSMLALAGIVLLGAGAATVILPNMPLGNFPDMGSILGAILPIVAMVAAMNMFLFSLSDNPVSGLLLHFFAAIGLCYVSGCIYPAYTFPKAMWPLSALLPTGIARSHLAACFTMRASDRNLPWLLLYTVIFCCLACLLRARKTRGAGR